MVNLKSYQWVNCPLVLFLCIINFMKIILNILKYLCITVSLLISILVGIISCCIVLLSCVSNVTIFNVLFLGLYFIPTVLVFVIFFFSNKYIGKYSILLKTLSYIAICILVNFHITILAYTLSYSLGCTVEKNETYNPIRPISEYSKFVKNRTTRTAHFPDEIPPNATNVELYRNYMFHGDVEEYLKFNIDNGYINNELKNYQYTTIITGDKYTGHPPRGRGRDKDDVYYILGDLLQWHRGYSYGIVVNRKTHEIIYYYSSY